ncbi:MAG: hypothetical protein KKG09_00405 [Verrucomicrobia bacterium]|nr:hypothetical protein [Verrucomicrobiota bacterium]MCG2679654.1 hypothetical protein [Kiritimatiellia bacterium]MBU4247945.1 hypothetical protein [Verrucomicrobiota bacterium]MBU4291442.1 hypothetical protein [Verrucomicrobiota bacterium]MBU4428378.1 hypothetical protein [Verrucomicrobiota bacterium]
MQAGTVFVSFARRFGIGLLALGLVLPFGSEAQTPRGPVRSRTDGKPRPALTWKALWVHAALLQNKGQMELMARRAKGMGFNVIIAEPSADMVSAVHGEGLQLYAWVITLKGLAPSEFYPANPGFLQMVTPEEEALINMPRENPDRDNIHPGPWLCPDYGLLPVERQALESLVKQYPVEGIALENVGYRNYLACFCQYSETRRADYAKRHPTMTRTRIQLEFSEQSLVEYVREVADAVKAINPKLKLAIHINPEFDLNLRYGNKLEVDYCGETIAWCYPPFWSYAKITKRMYLFMQAEGEYQGDNRFVPFIGVYSGELKKSPERLQTEIRIARRIGTGVIMIGFYEALAENPDLADVVAQEMK